MSDSGQIPAPPDSEETPVMIGFWLIVFVAFVVGYTMGWFAGRYS